MVKVLASSIVFLLTFAAVKAQTPIVITDYPTVNTVPPVNSPQMLEWLKEIDLTGAPNIPKTTAPKGSPPLTCAAPDPNVCVWTCDACAADDVTSCALPNTWGLTFDDGPSTFTPTLLNYLKTSKLSASFFLIGSNVIQHPEIVKRELDEGHHLASHTWSHTALTSLSNEEIVAEMKWTEKAVMAATGQRLKYMRPPYGDINNRVRFVLKKMGYIPVDWTGDQFDTNDWKIGNGFTEAQAVTTFSTSLDTYVNGTKASGFYCLEHDVSDNTVKAALKLIPLGITRKINFANVAGCEKDAAPYQAGSSPLPSASGGAGKPTPTAGGNSTNGKPQVVSSSSSLIASVGAASVVAFGAAAFSLLA
ncbi:chitin deacetylase [Entomortierella beljakovae]|nr:chitin deacetylase [Entomortierella beljakovae]